MRYGAICKALNALPRAGGVLDQPAQEIVRLEQILQAFAQYDNDLMKKNEVRNKNRARHAPTIEQVIEQ